MKPARCGRRSSCNRYKAYAALMSVPLRPSIASPISISRRFGQAFSRDSVDCRQDHVRRLVRQRLGEEERHRGRRAGNAGMAVDEQMRAGVGARPAGRGRMPGYARHARAAGQAAGRLLDDIVETQFQLLVLAERAEGVGNREGGIKDGKGRGWRPCCNDQPVPRCRKRSCRKGAWRWSWEHLFVLLGWPPCREKADAASARPAGGGEPAARRGRFGLAGGAASAPRQPPSILEEMTESGSAIASAPLRRGSRKTPARGCRASGGVLGRRFRR